MSRRRLILLAVLGLLLRVAWVLWADPVIEESSVYYARMAENLWRGKLFVSIDERATLANQPLFTLLIALLGAVGIPSEAAGRCISIVFGSVLVLPVAMVACKMYGSRVATIVGLLVAGHPFLIGLSGSGFSETVYAFLALLGIALAFCADPGRGSTAYVIGGVLFGLAYLARVEGFMLPFLLLVFLYSSRDRTRKLNLKPAFAVMIPFCITVAPYVAFLSISIGRFSVEGKLGENYGLANGLASGIPEAAILFAPDAGSNLFKAKFENATSTNKESTLERAHFVIKQWARGAEILFQHLTGAGCLGQPILGALVCLGLFRTPWPRERILHEVLWVLFFAGSVLAYIVGNPVFVFRHLTMLLYVCLIWAGVGIVECEVWARETFRFCRRPGLVGCIAVSVILMSLLVLAGLGTHRLNAYDFGGEATDRELGLGLRKISETRGEGLMDGNPIAAFYAGRVLVPFPYCSSEEALQFIARHKVEFLVLRGRDTSRPYFADWLAHGVPDRRAVLVSRMKDRFGEPVLLYRWN